MSSKLHGSVMNVVFDLCLLEGCHYLGSTDVISLAVTPVVALSNQLIITLPPPYSFAIKGWVRVKLTRRIHLLGSTQPVPSSVPPPNHYRENLGDLVIWEIGIIKLSCIEQLNLKDKRSIHEM